MKTLVQAIKDFNERILRLPTPMRPQVLSNGRHLARQAHLNEELNEVEDAYTDGNPIDSNIEEVADGYADIIFIAMGSLIEMGINPELILWEVTRANQCKVNGIVTKRGHAHDAVKPEGWQKPNIKNILSKHQGL